MSETEICLLWWNLTFSNCLQKSSWLFWKGQNQVIKITVDISQLTYGKYRNDISFIITLAEWRLREKRTQSRFRCSRRKTFRRLLVDVWSSGRASLSNCRESSSHRVLKFWFKKTKIYWENQRKLFNDCFSLFARLLQSQKWVQWHLIKPHYSLSGPNP